MNIDLTVTRVVQNGPATVVFFDDGTKSVTKCRLGDEFDPTLGVAWALCKRIAKENGRSLLDFVASFLDDEQQTFPNADFSNEAAKIIAAYECGGAGVLASLVPNAVPPVEPQEDTEPAQTEAVSVDHLWPSSPYAESGYQNFVDGRRSPSRFTDLVDAFRHSDLSSTSHVYRTCHADYAVGRCAVRNVRAALYGYIRSHGFLGELSVNTIGDEVFLRKRSR